MWQLGGLWQSVRNARSIIQKYPRRWLEALEEALLRREYLPAFAGAGLLSLDLPGEERTRNPLVR